MSDKYKKLPDEYKHLPDYVKDRYLEEVEKCGRFEKVTPVSWPDPKAFCRIDLNEYELRKIIENAEAERDALQAKMNAIGEIVWGDNEDAEFEREPSEDLHSIGKIIEGEE
jgi:hypothetical protein